MTNITSTQIEPKHVVGNNSAVQNSFVAETLLLTALTTGIFVNKKTKAALRKERRKLFMTLLMQKLFHKKKPVVTEYDKFMQGVIYSLLGITLIILGIALKVSFLWIVGLIIGIPATIAWASRGSIVSR